MYACLVSTSFWHLTRKLCFSTVRPDSGSCFDSSDDDMAVCVDCGEFLVFMARVQGRGESEVRLLYHAMAALLQIRDPRKEKKNGTCRVLDKNLGPGCV